MTYSWDEDYASGGGELDLDFKSASWMSTNCSPSSDPFRVLLLRLGSPFFFESDFAGVAYTSGCGGFLLLTKVQALLHFPLCLIPFSFFVSREKRVRVNNLLHIIVRRIQEEKSSK